MCRGISYDYNVNMGWNEILQRES
ncbi:MAG: hypothetical protein RL114_868, partial [Actinomycetota bacterium]